MPHRVLNPRSAASHRQRIDRARPVAELRHEMGDSQAADGNLDWGVPAQRARVLLGLNSRADDFIQAAPAGVEKQTGAASETEAALIPKQTVRADDSAGV